MMHCYNCFRSPLHISDSPRPRAEQTHNNGIMCKSFFFDLINWPPAAHLLWLRAGFVFGTKVINILSSSFSSSFGSFVNNKLIILSEDSRRESQEAAQGARSIK